MYAVAAVGTARYNTAQEDNILASFLNCNGIILHTAQHIFQSNQLMIMRSKQRLCLDAVMDIFHNCVSNTHAVKGTSTAAHLVKDNQTVFRSVFQNLSYLVHLHHKGALACRQIITGTDARKNLVYRANARLTRRNKAADLRHQHQQRHLTHVG